MAGVVESALSKRGYQVTTAPSGQAALDHAAQEEPDLIVLDLGLPDVDGIDVCRRLRTWSLTPIIVLSADGDEDRKVTALDEGADDYVTKPFSMPELLARLRVAERHRDLASGQLGSTSLVVGALQIDTVGHRAVLADHELTLTRKEFALLSLLARNSGRVLTHAAIQRAVWGEPSPSKAASLRVHVTQLRNKLGSGTGRPQLLSEPGVGYRLTLDDASPADVR